MKILILNTHLNTGGITSYLLTLCRGLCDSGHQVWLGSSGGERSVEFERMGVNLVEIDLKTKSDLSPKIYKAVEPFTKLIQQQKIEIVHSHTRVTQVLGRLLQRKVGTGYTATCHGFFKPRLSRRLAPCWGDVTIAISQAVYDHLLDDFGRPSDRIELIENGIDLKRFSTPDADDILDSRKSLGITDDPVIGIIARLSDVKGIDVLIRAMQQVTEKNPNAKLVILGQGKEEHALKNLTRDLDLQETVKFFPTVNATQTSLAAFDVFVMPSRQEGLGLSVMEAQACGCAVVASRVGGLVSLIEDGKTGLLVDPENSSQLANALIRLLEDRPLAQQLGVNAQKFIRQNYSADRMVSKTVDLYSRLVV